MIMRLQPRFVVSLLAAALVLASSGRLAASGLVGLYGIVEKVVLEPSEANPERVQVWGAFAYADGGVARNGETSSATKGYLYFRLDPAATDAMRRTVRAEWADLKRVAGTGEAVGFGQWFYIGPFAAMRALYAPAGGDAVDVRVRPATDPLANPAVYTTNTGLVKLTPANHAAVIEKLRAALR